jgi:hypothetical protein
MDCLEFLARPALLSVFHKMAIQFAVSHIGFFDLRREKALPPG